MMNTLVRPRGVVNRSDPGDRLMFNKADYFILVAALASFLYSVALWFGMMGAPNKEGGLFVAVWVPSILSLGCFAKIATRVRSDG